jgi:hypothetical protein
MYCQDSKQLSEAVVIDVMWGESVNQVITKLELFSIVKKISIDKVATQVGVLGKKYSKCTNVLMYWC